MKDVPLPELAGTAMRAALERSGKSVCKFAEEHDLDPQRLWLWRRRVAGGDNTTFRELIVRPAEPTTTAQERPAFEIGLPSGIVIRVPAAFEPAALAQLLDVLAQARTC